MTAAQPATEEGARLSKTRCANLIRYVPSGRYFARIRVRGKLILNAMKKREQSVLAGVFLWMVAAAALAAVPIETKKPDGTPNRAAWMAQGTFGVMTHYLISPKSSPRNCAQGGEGQGESTAKGGCEYG
jgi:hypothetical protein